MTLLNIGAVPNNLIPPCIEFNSVLDLTYQQSRRLKGICQERNVTGSSKFVQNYIEPVEIISRPFSNADVPITPFGTGTFEISPLSFVIRQALGKDQATITNVDMLSGFSRVHAEAIGRATDSLLLNSMFVLDQPLPGIQVIPETIGPNTGLNVDKLIAANTYLNNLAVTNHRFAFCNTDQAPTLLKDPSYNNYLISMINPLKTWNPDYAETYLDTWIRYLATSASNSIPVIDDPTYSYPGATGGATADAKISYVVLMAPDNMQLNYNESPNTIMVPEEFNRRTNVVTAMVGNAGFIKANGIVMMKVVLKPDGTAWNNV